MNKLVNRKVNKHINKNINNLVNKDIIKVINKDINKDVNTLTVAKGLSAYFLFSKKTINGYGRLINLDRHHDIQVYQPSIEDGYFSQS